MPRMRRAWLIAVVLLSACGGSQPPAESTPTPPAAGSFGDTWAWDGVAWHRAASSGPAPTYSASLAYDAGHRVYVLFGGHTAKGESDQTWTWDGVRWKLMSPAHKPGARRTAAMAYDPTHQVVVLYGGLVADRGEGAAGADTWTWDGTDWTEAGVGSGAPGHREGSSMVTAGDRVILFGGKNFNTDYRGDAWTWDGNSWTRLDKDPTPRGRGNTAIAWNPTDSSLLLFGGTGLKAAAGIGALGEPLGDAWSLTGGMWKRLNASGPPALARANAIWDAKNKRLVVLLGMPCPDPSPDAWAWDGSAWAKLANPGIPARWGAASAQAQDGKAVLFGGSNAKGC